MGKLIWNRGGAASPSLAVSYVLGSGGCGGIGTTTPNRQKRSASEIELELGKLSLRKNSVSSARGTNRFVRACTCEWSRHQSRPLLDLINSSALLLSFGDPQGTRIALLAISRFPPSLATRVRKTPRRSALQLGVFSAQRALAQFGLSTPLS